MARQRQQPSAGGADTVDENATVAAQAEELRAAEERREREANRAQEAKSVPDDSGPPPYKGDGDDRKIRLDRLIAEAPERFDTVEIDRGDRPPLRVAITPAVAAGAFASFDKEYATVPEAAKHLEKWLGTEVS